MTYCNLQQIIYKIFCADEAASSDIIEMRHMSKVCYTSEIVLSILEEENKCHASVEIGEIIIESMVASDLEDFQKQTSGGEEEFWKMCATWENSNPLGVFSVRNCKSRSYLGYFKLYEFPYDPGNLKFYGKWETNYNDQVIVGAIHYVLQLYNSIKVEPCIQDKIEKYIQGLNYLTLPAAEGDLDMILTQVGIERRMHSTPDGSLPNSYKIEIEQLSKSHLISQNEPGYARAVNSSGPAIRQSISLARSSYYS